MIQNLEFEYAAQKYRVDTDKPCHISIPLQAGIHNPNCYWASPPQFETISFDNFTGNVEEGGSCNYRKVTFTPHGNGTHTECYGHISADKTATVNKCLRHFFWMAELVSIQPEKIPNGDQVIGLDCFDKSFFNKSFDALIIRTLPNEVAKKQWQYSGTNPPYLHPEFAGFLAERDVQHLLIDLPSVDKEEDNGLLAAHRAFWQYPGEIRKECTITELIYVDDAVSDGAYLLNLQITSIELDASPSKPVLYPIQKL